ncbi:MAG: hypothetical protein LRS49_04260 [Desulfurococcales archaeon]|nr:hypothetical protein [Desulfurococcales archaeon]
MGPVDLLWTLDLLLGRAAAVGADFILAGPVNLWLRGVAPPPREPRFILVTSREYGRRLIAALRVGATHVEEPPQGAPSWLTARIRLRGALVEVVEDPIIEGKRATAASLAREADTALVGKYPLRLAPLWLEAALAEALES